MKKAFTLLGSACRRAATVVLLSLITCQLFAQVQVQQPADDAITPYVDFLKNENTSAGDYILSLLKEKDIVILCERDHREMTQYELILRVIQDSYFIENGGVVYTEVGDRNLNPALNAFLCGTQALSHAEIRSKILEFQRNAMSPMWKKTSFSYFLKRIYDINGNLPPEKKIRMYPLDFLGVLEDPSAENIIRQYKSQGDRDSLMANEFFSRYQEVGKDPAKKKALIIMNSRHAFKRDIAAKSGYLIRNFGRFVVEKYPDKTANVLINNWSQGEGADFYNLVQDGKWDAAFQYLDKENVGFDMGDSPFGSDRLDLGKWMLENNDFTYQDIFDGFVFYRPLGKFEIGMGVNGLMDDNFYEKFIERLTLFNTAFQREVFPTGNRDEYMKYNRQQITPMNDLEKLQQKIDRWLQLPRTQ